MYQGYHRGSGSGPDFLKDRNTCEEDDMSFTSPLLINSEEFECFQLACCNPFSPQNVRPHFIQSKIQSIKMMSTSSNHTQVTLLGEWGNENEMMQGEELSATSHEETSKVFDMWQTDELDVMEVDEQMSLNLLGDDTFFHDSSMSPAGYLEELVLMSLEEDDVGRFSLTLISEDEAPDMTSSLPFEERCKATLKKLAERMKHSQETRKGLAMNAPKTKEYPRTRVLSSIEKSTQELLKVNLKNWERV
jgi:hypothetical protein